VNCAIVDLMFLSFYCDYIVDEFAVIFCLFSKKFSEIINFLPLFSAGVYFRRLGDKPPKICYFRRPGVSRRKSTVIFGDCSIGHRK
jgi:hypothetical protein